REGFLSGPLAPVDSVVPVGGVLAYLVSEPAFVRTDSAALRAHAGMESVAAAAKDERRPHPVPGHRPPPVHVPGAAAPAPRPDNKQASPYARKLAGELHVNLNTLKGSGPGGVIVAEDVRHAQPIERPTEVAEQIPAHVMPEIQVPGHGRPMTAMERAVSHSMTAALTMPTFRVTIHAKPDALIRAAKKAGVSVTVAIAKACALAIGKHPSMNWAYQPVDKLVERDFVDIGMAVAAEGGGLVVPVLRQCESRSLEELDAEWKDLVARGRVRRLRSEERR